MKKSPGITEAEWPIMEVLWNQGTATAAEIVAEVTRGREVSMRTIKSLIRRLISKDLVGFSVDSHDARVYHYRPLISKEQGVGGKNQSLLQLVYKNNAGEFLTNFVQNADLTETEISRLEALLKKKRAEGGRDE